MTEKERLQLAYDSIEAKKNYAYYYKSNTEGEFAFDVNGENLYIFCMPSNSLRDFKINFWCLSEETEYGRFHKGYYKECEKFLDYLSSQIDYSLISNIYIDGYSYGGGTAQILTCVFGQFIENMQSFTKKHGRHTFKVKHCSGVSMEGAKSINSRANKLLKLYDHTELYCVNNSNDIVTKVPFNFVHGGKVIYIGDKRKWYKTDVQLFPFYFNKKETGFQKFFTITSHEYKNFKKNLKEFIEKL